MVTRLGSCVSRIKWDCSVPEDAGNDGIMLPTTERSDKIFVRIPMTCLRMPTASALQVRQVYKHQTIITSYHSSWSNRFHNFFHPSIRSYRRNISSVPCAHEVTHAQAP